jgi:hypothetical protein
MLSLVCWVMFVIGYTSTFRWLVSAILRKNPQPFWHSRFYWLFFRRNARYERILTELRARTVEYGLPPAPMSVWTIRRWVCKEGWAAQMDVWSGIVLIHTARGPYSDEDIACILAHEYGHQVDHFWGRKCHPSLARFAHLDNKEDFCDIVAAYLYGSETVLHAFRRHRICRNEPLLQRVSFTRPVRIRT